MSALDDLKTRIDSAIYSNTEQNITGDGLQTVLDDMVDTMGVSVSQNTITIGGEYKGEVSTTYDVTLHNSGATFASLEALLSDADLATLIPTNVRKGGMTIKFVQSSDNKYIQARCMAQNFTTDVTQWQGVGITSIYNGKNLSTLEDIDNKILYSNKALLPFSPVSQISINGYIDTNTKKWVASENFTSVIYEIVASTDELQCENIASSVNEVVFLTDNNFIAGNPAPLVDNNSIHPLGVNEKERLIIPNGTRYILVSHSNGYMNIQVLGQYIEPIKNTIFSNDDFSKIENIVADGFFHTFVKRSGVNSEVKFLEKGVYCIHLEQDAVITLTQNRPQVGMEIASDKLWYEPNSRVYYVTVLESSYVTIGYSAQSNKFTIIRLDEVPGTDVEYASLQKDKGLNSGNDYTYETIIGWNTVSFLVRKGIYIARIYNITKEIKNGDAIFLSDNLPQDNDTYTNISSTQSAYHFKEEVINVDSEKYINITYNAKASVSLVKVTDLVGVVNNVNFNSSKIVLAASDSSEWDKATSDYVCAGKDDAWDIDFIISMFLRKNGGKIILKTGRYFLGSVRDNSCINIVYGGNFSKSIEISGEIRNENDPLSVSQEDNNGAQLYMLDDLYDSFDNTTIYKVINCRAPFLRGCVTLKNFGIVIPSNQKKIIALDQAEFTGLIDVEDIYINGFNATKEPQASISVPSQNMPVEGYIGVRTTSGVGMGTIACYYRGVICQGFHTGFDVNGEHTYLDRCCSVQNVYGYTFNKYDYENNKTPRHPILLMRCQDERGVNLPKFYDSPEVQPIHIVDMNIERIASAAPGEQLGYFATEQTPNSRVGKVSYSVATNIYGEFKNRVNVPFWEDNCGKGFKTSNLLYTPSATKNVIESWKPNFCQRCYVTDLSNPRELICVDVSTSKWVDMMGTECYNSNDGWLID